MRSSWRGLLAAAFLVAAAPLAAQAPAAPLGISDTVVGRGPIAAPGTMVSVRYTGWLSNGGKRGVKFDSSEGHGGGFLDFPLGAGQVIPGWDQGIVGMRVGGKRTLTIPPALGYGADGAGDVIPPNATLIFDVELVAVAQP